MIQTPEDMSGLSAALPASSAKCKRADILPGSCIRLQPLAPSSSKLVLLHLDVTQNDSDMTS